MAIGRDEILDSLRGIKHPETRKSIVESGMVENLQLEGQKVRLNLLFQKPKDPFSASLKKTVEAGIKKLDQGLKVEINTVFPAPVQAQENNYLERVKNIVAITSGKGGVGKSTLAANLAVAMAKRGAKVGLLDADVYGPSQPKMFGVEGQRPEMKKEGDTDLIIPIEKHGVRLVSIGFFVKPEDALVWRGPMATSALKQLLSQTDWGVLDYLFIDMPPGTGDIHLTIVQEIALTGAVIVSTPQEVALADVVKGIAMFTGDKVNVPLLGLIENMSWFTPAELPDNKYYIFGKEGVRKLADKMNVSFLGQIPLVQTICERGDGGAPSVLEEENETGEYFRVLAENIEKAVNERNQRLAPTERVKISNS